ncbi:zinc finger protein 25-like [Leguminivora glycinivorella]|uniref:zinc finger protein 25-like n=1 Tax=Leguminivora glycinivorella TaxID=1035111 RepID=UPI00200DB878|nr:zinc finger protein 25-like [Leguminivora glycinivorella]
MCSNSAGIKLEVKTEPASPPREDDADQMEVAPCQLLFTEHMSVKVEVEVEGGDEREGVKETSTRGNETEHWIEPWTEVPIKEEPETVRVKPSRPSSEAGMQAGVYLKHEIEIELAPASECHRSVSPYEVAVTTSQSEDHIHTHLPGFNFATEKEDRHQTQAEHKCSFCDYKNHKKSAILTHERKHTGEKPFQCEHCDYRATHKAYMRTHMRTHTDERPYNCNFCDFKCRFKSGLISHAWVHTGEKKYKCKHCDYAATTDRLLRSHQMTHTGEMPFQCKICNIKCRTKRSLLRHEYSAHSSEKRFECNKCEFKGKKKEDLRNHELIHTGKTLYSCNYCDYKFVQKSNLRTHEMRHTGEKPFHCDQCEYKCKMNRDLQKHLRAHARGKTRFVANTATTSAGNEHT